MKSPSQALRTARRHPFAASSDALGEIHPGKQATAPMLLAWSVPVVCFDPAETLAVLGDRAHTARYSASVQFLTEVVAFARELVGRGRVLPALDRTRHGPVARWRPVPQEPDVTALHARDRSHAGTPWREANHIAWLDRSQELLLTELGRAQPDLPRAGAGAASSPPGRASAVPP